MALLGLDIGTTGCKASIIDYEGNVKAQAYKEYFLEKPRPGWEEINPNTVWSSVKEVIRKALSENTGDTIRAISISSFGEAVVPVDKNGNALDNSIIYIDVRGQEEAGFLEEKTGFERVLAITGASIHPMYSLCKIMWIKKNKYDVYKNTWRFFLFADFILYKLGAGSHTDYSLAARTMAFDIINKTWSSEILDAAGIDKDKFAEPVQSGTVVGEISSSAAYELGLPEGVILAAGGHDQACAALGAGVINSNIAVDGIGTVECITPAVKEPVVSMAMAKNSFVCVPHVIKDMYVTYAFNFTAGSILKWFRDNFGYEEKLKSIQSGINVYDVMINESASSPSEIFVMPHFAGAATPYMDMNSKGVILGLNINTKKEDIIKAILEGLNYEMMVNLDGLERAGIIVNELRAVGGLAKSDKFLQLKADVMGKKVVSLNVSEAGTLGVAILAGLAGGVYKSVDQATENLIKVNREFYPVDKLHSIYREKFEIYKRIYPAFKSICLSDRG